MKTSDLKAITKSIEAHRAKDKQIALAGLKRFVQESPAQVVVKIFDGVVLTLGKDSSMLYAKGIGQADPTVPLDNEDLEVLLDIIDRLVKNG